MENKRNKAAVGHRLWLSVRQILLICGSVLPSLGCSPQGDVPFFETKDWLGSYQGLALRRENVEQGALLLRSKSKPDLIKRYDPNSKTLVNVAPEVWDRAGGAIAECEDQSGYLSDEDRQGFVLKGKQERTLAESPSGTRVAVLSASGVGSPSSIIPFLGGSSAIIGPHWHQVYSLEKHQMEPGAVRIPVTLEWNSFRACWSADEQFVVYHESSFYFLSIVHLKQ